jgi:molybdopterin synthase catalytic subunit
MAENVPITLRLFAVFRETLGASTLAREVPRGATVGQVLAQLIAENPGLAGAESAVSFSVNRSYAAAETVLQAGDEVAFIPPVSGGSLLLGAVSR